MWNIRTFWVDVLSKCWVTVSFCSFFRNRIVLSIRFLRFFSCGSWKSLTFQWSSEIIACHFSRKCLYEDSLIVYTLFILIGLDNLSLIPLVRKVTIMILTWIGESLMRTFAINSMLYNLLSLFLYVYFIRKGTKSSKEIMYCKCIIFSRKNIRASALHSRLPKLQ